ncbi:hypothetical protein AOC36_11615 [Erysipelothrix larvae]|uniref:Membrane insertase YidC/Oxa/ALB C-terminal domain-containing protein n=1 Tax=Erysipelothrix larvae TaxID=1514105 RepID=A0A0X8H1Z3_9FIRM|nr:YidC/Oxa1 family membrane protein insertase [Erysipelothrix larvae]AMC94597.1 hypothetical protein AOC36_11615 [Erysipelothrix larvae]
MEKSYKKYRKYLVLALLLLVLVGCRRLTDANGNIMEEVIIRLGDPFPWGKEGEGWFSIFIVWPISQAFNLVAKYTGSAFISIVTVTLIINALKFGLTIKQTIQQQKMQLIQPELNRIQEKYKGRTDNQAKMQQSAELQKVYQKHEISPFGALVPLFIQLPVIMAMYQAVQRADLIIHGSILGQTLKATPREGFTTGNPVYIAIFITMAIAQAASMFLPQYLLKRRQKQRKYDKPQGPNTNTMMFMSLAMILFFAFTWNIGMSLYWAITALVQLFQTLYIQWKYTDNNTN